MGRYSEGVYWIPSHVRRGFDAEKIVYLSVPVVSLEVFLRGYQFYLAVIEVSNIIERGVPKYGL